MSAKVRKGGKNRTPHNKSQSRGDKERPESEMSSVPKTASACVTVLSGDVMSIAGAARLSIAAVEDMLAGGLTPQEATVVNTATGRVLKATELYLRYARSGADALQLNGS